VIGAVVISARPRFCPLARFRLVPPGSELSVPFSPFIDFNSLLYPFPSPSVHATPKQPAKGKGIDPSTRVRTEESAHLDT